MRLLIEGIREDPSVQLRGGLDMDRVEAMAEFVEQGGQLPPITVVGDDNLLADGHHRLYVAMTTGMIDIDANRVPGGPADAVALAIRLNDIATSQPLNRVQRNDGVKLLLAAGWTQDRIGKATGVSQHTVSNIATVAAAKIRLGSTLNDTTVLRIAEMVDEGKQAEFAAAVEETRLPEPRVRDAAKALRATPTMTPREAVASVTPRHMEMPRTLPDVAKQARRRLERFLEEPMTVEGVERDFWAVMDVLAANVDLIPLEAGSLARLLAEVAVKADAYSSRLNSAKLIEATA